jgi:uncharacterized membrane protein YadS
MNIPIELLAALLAVLLGAVLNSQRSLRTRIDNLEKKVLTLIVMLHNRGFEIPSDSDTDLFFKTDL